MRFLKLILKLLSLTGDKARPSGKTCLHPSPSPYGGLQGRDPHQVLHHLPILLQSDNICLRPEIDVYVRTFDGFALTADTWEHQRQILLDDLIGKKVTEILV